MKTFYIRLESNGKIVILREEAFTRKEAIQKAVVKLR